MTSRRRGPVLVPFPFQPPLVAEGGPVWCRDVSGKWHRKIARSKPRYDTANALGGRCYLTVALSTPGQTSSVNWPAEAVRTAPPPGWRYE